MSASDPFSGLLGDLLKLIGTGVASGSDAWMDAARTLAHSVATDGKPEGNADPLDRIALEDVARVAELHVVEATGLSLGDRPLSLTPVGPGAFASRVLEAWAPALSVMVAAQRGGGGPAPGGEPTEGGDGSAAEIDTLFGGPAPDLDEPDAAGLDELLGKLATTMGPVLLGMQFGSAAGHLAQRALGQYALPLPWPPSGELLVVTANVARFASEWSLPADETRLWVSVRELTTHAVLSRPHVTARLRELLDAVATDAATAQRGLTERLAGEAGDPESFQRLLADPESLLADLLSPGQRRTSADLVALTTAIGAYVDHVTADVAGRLTGGGTALSEAWHRRRAQDDAGERAAGALFGLDLDRTQMERGTAFVRGVVERAGDAGLARLWASARTLPTPAELDAPGLWLERIDLPDDEGGDEVDDGGGGAGAAPGGAGGTPGGG